MDVPPALVADRQPAEARQPGQRPFHDPAVAAELLAGLDPPARNAAVDATLAEALAAARDVVGLVRMDLRWTDAGSPAPAGALERLDRFEQRLEDFGVVNLGGSQPTGERNAAGIDHNMALRAWFAAIRGIRADLLGRTAPLWPGPRRC